MALHMDMRTGDALTPALGPHRFDRFELHPGERLLLADGVPVAIGARAFDLLVALSDRPGRLITKDDLLAAVWPGLVVEENNVQVQVSTLRKILGPSALATIPGRGYRFNLPVASADAGAPAHAVDGRAIAADARDENAAPTARTNYLRDYRHSTAARKILLRSRRGCVSTRWSPLRAPAASARREWRKRSLNTS
jgi:DNA-binding winged helix-turn-helix (wHTH) protein